MNVDRLQRVNRKLTDSESETRCFRGTGDKCQSNRYVPDVRRAPEYSMQAMVSKCVRNSKRRKSNIAITPPERNVVSVFVDDTEACKGFGRDELVLRVSHHIQLDI
jgi:hypothetical protein